jgi:hypothetical protein
VLNDPAFAECARALGFRVLRECRGPREDRIRLACRISLAREPDETESDVLARVYEAHRALYGTDRTAATELLGDEALPPGVSPPEAAAWVAVARTLLNLDEFITRE